MCGAKEILLKNVRDKGNPIEILEKTSQSEPHPSPHRRDPWKSWKKTSQSADHPLDRRKSWKKPHNLRTITGTAGNPGKKPHNITDLLVGWSWLELLVPTSRAEAPCGGKNVRGKGNPIEKMCAAKGNPIEKCARRRKSYRKMCAAKEIV